MSAYAKLSQRYGIDVRMRSRVRFKTNPRLVGNIIQPLDHLPDRYVRVKFDGEHNGTNCHPLDLEYGLPPEAAE
jgi:hypothetical protein